MPRREADPRSCSRRRRAFVPTRPREPEGEGRAGGGGRCRRHRPRRRLRALNRATRDFAAVAFRVHAPAPVCAASETAFGSAAAPQNTKRREPRPRLTATGRGEPPPRLKPGGLTRRRPAATAPSGWDAVASARKPRIARTRKRGKPFVEARKGFATALEALIRRRMPVARNNSSRRSANSAALRGKFMNTERPTAGRQEKTGSCASRIPVGFVAPSGCFGFDAKTFVGLTATALAFFASGPLR